ncbi:MAG: phage tail family protein [Dehalococcoidia bacterium]|nr:phage tail family protein [Dehalococcoidia bacterium]
MANSLTFNGTDLSTYGLTVKSRSIPVEFQADSVQVEDISYAGNSKIPPKSISLEVAVTGSSIANLKTNIDSILSILNIQIDAHLILDSLSDRYWEARFKSLSGKYKGVMFEGTLDFICFDPLAYAVGGSSDVTAITLPTADYASVLTGGTALIRPVYSLLADAGQTSPATILLHNDNTDEEISWAGAIVNGQTLVIDTALWIVTLAGVESMSTVLGQFPTLVQNTTNLILVSGFSGTITVTWRNRFI